MCLCAPLSFVFCILNSKAPREYINGTTTLDEYRINKGKLPGEYVLNGTIIPSISETKNQWGVLILFSVLDTQMIITDDRIYIRRYSGSPSAWTRWTVCFFTKL